MNVIYKYKLNGPGEDTIISFPKNNSPKLLHFDFVNGNFYVWIELYNDGYNFPDWTFSVVGTGWEYDGSALKTVIVGDFVWHLIFK